MLKKPFFTGVSALALAYVLLAAGCEWSADGGKDAGYTFRLKVDNNTSAVISRVEFINGDAKNDAVLASGAYNLAAGGRSAECSVPGFTVEYGRGLRVCGVRVTFADTGNAPVFGWQAYGHESKVLVSVSDSFYSPVRFSYGNW